MMDHPAIAARFPLVCRTKPRGLPLAERVEALASSAVDAAGAGRHVKVARASGVINMASLIASDVGLRDWAFQMCWNHYGIYADAADLDDPRTAVMATQPLINIARLLTRDGERQNAFDTLEELCLAARHRRPAQLGSKTVDVPAIIRTPQAHLKVYEFLYVAMLTDGLRALAQAGSWTQAAEAVIRHNGMSDRLYDGRQAGILALVEHGRIPEAIEAVEASLITDSSEKVVAALLRTFCALEGGRSDIGLDLALGEALALIEHDDQPTVYFRTQAALTALALADAAGGAQQQAVRLRQVVLAAARTDAYAARSALTALDEDAKELRPVVYHAGFGRSRMPVNLMDQMAASVTAAESRMSELLGTRCG